MLARVVHPIEHHVLDEHLAAVQLEMAAALGEDVLERIAVVHRHQPAAQRVGRCVQREREADRLADLVDESPQAGQPADGRDRRAPVRDADVGQPARGREHGVDVEHRLAHPHEDDMVDLLSPAEVHLPGGAERARERAAGLRGHANGTAPVAVAHEHRLDGVPLTGVEQRLDGAVP